MSTSMPDTQSNLQVVNTVGTNLPSDKEDNQDAAVHVYEAERQVEPLEKFVRQLTLESQMIPNEQDSRSDATTPILCGAQMDNCANGSVMLPSTAKRYCSQWSQTELTFPPVLPSELEAIVSKYFDFNGDLSITSIQSSTRGCGNNDDGKHEATDQQQNDSGISILDEDTDCNKEI